MKLSYPNEDETELEQAGDELEQEGDEVSY